MMTRAKKQGFDQLSARERSVVGSPDDYEWAHAITLPERARPEVTQFSLRVDRSLFGELQAIARGRGATFSDVAREALERYAQSGGRPAVSNIQVSFSRDAGLLLQVEGGRAELAANRRSVSPDEKVPVLAGASITH
jgi:hypothetical protein